MNEDEMTTFIYSKGGGLYPSPTISRQLKELNISKNVVSTEVNQAFTHMNLLKVELL
jgi:hypothetical protein